MQPLSFLAQPGNHVQAAHVGHVIVDDQVTERWQAVVIKQLMGRRIVADLEPFYLKTKLERFSDGGVVIEQQKDTPYLIR